MSDTDTPFDSEPCLEGTDFEFVKPLSSGAFGTVQLVRSKTSNQLFAAKFIPRGEQVTKYVQREIIALRSLFHPHVVAFKEVFLTRGHLGIAMEYAAGGDLFKLVKERNGLPEAEVHKYFLQLILGLDYIHRRNFVSRDIKLENLVIGVSGGRRCLKICDFGFAKGEFDSQPATLAGTLSYIAPEVLSGGRGETYDGKTSDIWSCAVVLYVMLFSSYPFDQPEDAKLNIKQKRQILYARICAGRVKVPMTVSAECEDLLYKMLEPDPGKRLISSEVMRHPWVAKGMGAEFLTFNESPALVPPANASWVQSEETIKMVCKEAATLGR